MDREKFINDFRVFLEENREQVEEKMIRFEDLPEDDDWRNDELWTAYDTEEVVNV